MWTYSIKGHLIFKDENSRRWIWHHVDEFSKHFRTSLHVEHTSYIWSEITCMIVNRYLHLDLRRIPQRIQLCAQIPFVLLPPQERNAANMRANFILCWMSLAVCELHTPCFTSAVLTAALVNSTSVWSMHSFMCLGFHGSCTVTYWLQM